MPSIAVPCPACQWTHEVDAQLRGQQIHCEQCGASFTVPGQVSEADGEDVLPGSLQEPSPGLQCLRVEEDGDVVVARVIVSRPDTDTVEILGEELLGLVKPKRKLVIDLAAVEFLSSAGLGKLVSLDRRMQAMVGSELRLCGMTPAVRQTFAHSGLQCLFQIFDDCQEALSGL